MSQTQIYSSLVDTFSVTATFYSIQLHFQSRSVTQTVHLFVVAAVTIIWSVKMTITPRLQLLQHGNFSLVSDILHTK